MATVEAPLPSSTTVRGRCVRMSVTSVLTSAGEAAQQAGAYTLTDRGTFLTVQDEGALAAHVDRGIEDPPELLRNDYAVVPTNPARHDVAYPLAMAFVGYLTGPARSRIAAFRVEGERAFRPLGPDEDPDFRQYVPSDWPG